jgi:hypothetical protein
MKNFVKKEINNLNNNETYYGSKENINNENKIFNYLLNNKIVNQDYFDNKLKYTNVELLEEILKEIN